jgi:hypothetical protein
MIPAEAGRSDENISSRHLLLVVVLTRAYTIGRFVPSNAVFRAGVLRGMFVIQVMRAGRALSAVAIAGECIRLRAELPSHGLSRLTIG